MLANPAELSRLVGDAIERHLPREQLKVLEAAEASEQQAFFSIAQMLSPDPATVIDPSGFADYEARINNIEAWIQRGAPAPPADEVAP